MAKLERELFGESGRERERARRRLPGDGGRADGWGRGWDVADSARMTRTRDALADRPRMRRGPSAGGVTW